MIMSNLPTSSQFHFFSNPHRRDVTSDMPEVEVHEFAIPALVATGTAEIQAYEAGNVQECLEEEFA
ncbi:hypothetical protein ABN448_09520 [Delftia acidovorans]|uniref:hypothetical protein n=1 Tax=Delftia acidovorans TaxID=80866 RepID=UPI0032DE6A90